MKYVVLFASLIIPTLSNAATLVGDNGVEILAIDGQKIKSSFFGSETAEVSDGEHQVVVKYANNFNKNDMIESKPHIFNVNIQGDTEITVKNIYTQNQAESAIRKGLTWIVENDGPTQKIVGSDALSGEGYLPYRDIEKLVRNYNQEKGLSIAAAAVPAVAVAATSSKSANAISNVSDASAPSNVVNNDKQSPASTQLIQLYNSASKEERRMFRIWLVEQDMK